MDMSEPSPPEVQAEAPLVIQTPEAVKAAEAAALNVHKKLNLQAAPIRQYLGLQAVCKERPENPVEYLAYYLLSNNPQGSKLPSARAAVTAAVGPPPQ